MPSWGEAIALPGSFSLLSEAAGISLRASMYVVHLRGTAFGPNSPTTVITYTRTSRRAHHFVRPAPERAARQLCALWN